MPTICLLTIRKNWFCLHGEENIVLVEEIEGANVADSLSSSLTAPRGHSIDVESSPACASNVSSSEPLVFCLEHKWLIWAFSGWRTLVFGRRWECRRADTSSSPSYISGTWWMHSAQWDRVDGSLQLFKGSFALHTCILLFRVWQINPSQMGIGASSSTHTTLQAIKGTISWNLQPFMAVRHLCQPRWKVWHQGKSSVPFSTGSQSLPNKDRYVWRGKQDTYSLSIWKAENVEPPTQWHKYLQVA